MKANLKKGQIVLILLLVMSVVLGIGLSVVQRSFTDVSTSTKVEQSTRAFSAAEAGIERAINASPGPVISQPLALGNDAFIAQANTTEIPFIGQALEYPPVGREEIAQIFLATPATLSAYYTQTSLDIYWGRVAVLGRERPAIEINLIHKNSVGTYLKTQYFYDPHLGTDGRPGNGFADPASLASSGCAGYTLDTTGGSGRQFLCRVRLTSLPSSPSVLTMVRMRLLYLNDNQPLAVSGVGSCGTACSLPPQAKMYISVGTSGETQRKIQVFSQSVVPFLFDFALFSTREITK